MASHDHGTDENKVPFDGLSEAFATLHEQIRQAGKTSLSAHAHAADPHGYCVAAEWNDTRGILAFIPFSGEHGLSPRQLEVACLILRGLTTKEIAHKLEITKNSVISHVRRIFDRQGVTSRVELAMKLLLTIFPENPGSTVIK